MSAHSVSKITETPRLLFLSLVASCAGPMQAPPDAGPVASPCASCHPSHTAQFETSRHATAAVGPRYVALRDQSDLRTRAFCDSCHRPVVGTARGLSCESCHVAVGNTGTSNARLVWDRNGAIRGSFNAVQTAGHRSAVHGFISSAELCGTCHEVRGPGAFHETPYTEWAASPSATRGETCADCHMSPTPGQSSPRARGPAANETGIVSPERSLADHRFVGPDHDDAPSLLRDVLTIALAREGDELVATVQNTLRGHYYPTGARFIREAWMEVAATRIDGSRVVLRGALDSLGRLQSGPLAPLALFHDELAAGLPAESAIVSVRAMAPLERRVFRMVVGSESPVISQIIVRARYRPASVTLLQSLNVDTLVPVYEVASASIPW
ncbi:MAG: hypothetical protein Q8Q09_04300 [Deltaproteobacteria bacterium]|nr:hypothetical protein [Deltaproteobacteria bacterium]